MGCLAGRGVSTTLLTLVVRVQSYLLITCLWGDLVHPLFVLPGYCVQGTDHNM